MKRQIMQATVVRLDKNGIPPSVKPNSFWLMNKQTTGWSSHGYPYPTLEALLDEWDIELGAHGEDEHGLFIEAKPIDQLKMIVLKPRSPPASIKFDERIIDGMYFRT